MENEIENDMFGQPIMDEEALEERAREIFYGIRDKYFSSKGFCVDSVDISEEYSFVTIYISEYFCGNTYYDDVTFPVSYLYMTDEELDAKFAEERAQFDAENEKKEQERKEKERIEREAWEKKELLRLLDKYGDIRNT